MHPSEAVRTGWPTQPFVLVGTVEHGDQRGRMLGFATANLPLQRDAQSPAEGVYAGVAVTADGRAHRREGDEIRMRPVSDINSWQELFEEIDAVLDGHFPDVERATEFERSANNDGWVCVRWLPAFDGQSAVAFKDNVGRWQEN